MLQVSCLRVQKLPTIILNIGDREFRISGRHYVQKVSTTKTNYTVYLWFSCFFFFFLTICASGKFAKQKGNPMVFTRVHTKSRLIFRETVSAISRKEILIGRDRIRSGCLTVKVVTNTDKHESFCNHNFPLQVPWLTTHVDTNKWPNAATLLTGTTSGKTTNNQYGGVDHEKKLINK